ncbi:MAG: hypothetical protein WB992_18575 [Bryobacteraceae bacterium]
MDSPSLNASVKGTVGNVGTGNVGRGMWGQSTCLPIFDAVRGSSSYDDLYGAAIIHEVGQTKLSSATDGEPATEIQWGYGQGVPGAALREIVTDY